MTHDTRRILTFVAKHAAFGFGLSAVFVTALVWTDVGQLRTLFAGSPVGWLGAFLLFFFTGLTFASVQLGIAVMQIGRDDGGSAQKDRRLRVPAPVPVSAKARSRSARSV